MRTLILLLIFIFCLNAWSQSPASNELDEFIEIINQTQLENDVVYDLGGVLMADSCSTFMNRTEVLGPIGQSIYHLLTTSRPSFSRLMDGGQIRQFCPAYPKMKDEQKAIIWVLLMTTVAHFESTCNANATAAGPNGTAAGYFQLHKGKEPFYDQKAGYCQLNCSTDPKLSSRCALGLIEIQLGRAQGLIFSNRSYWDVLRPNGRARKADDIQRALRKFSMCNQPAA
ncbi:MAG: hypothetical protein ACAH59_09450 [Pseudobdellovibrionaceae bacterium]